jgi:hypothetical protein
VHFEGQTQFGYVPRPRQRPTRPLFDTPQPVAYRIRVADKRFGGRAHRRIAVLPDPKRFKQKVPFLVAEIVEMV